MPTNVRSLQVRPLRSTTLSFPLPGIIVSSLPRIGSLVQPADTSSLQGEFGTDPAAAGWPGPVAYSQAIASKAGPVALANVFNDALAAALDSAAVERDIVHLEKYEHRAALGQLFAEVYASGSHGRIAQLRELQRLVKQRRDDIQSAIEGNAAPGSYIGDAFKEQIYLEQTSTSVIPQMTSTISVSPMGTLTEAYVISVDNPAAHHSVDPVKSRPVKYDYTLYSPTDRIETQTSVSQPGGPQKTGTPLFDPRQPGADNKIRGISERMELEDRLLSQMAVSLKAPNIEEIWKKEMAAIDLELRRLQLTYLSTYLFAPFPGRVTALFKEQGEMVQPGEAVLRIEDDSELIFVAWIQRRDAVRVGDQATIVADLFERAGTTVRIPATVIAVRGHDDDNDEWDLLLQGRNLPNQWNIAPPLVGDENERLHLPINYKFDRDNTEVLF